MWFSTTFWRSRKGKAAKSAIVTKIEALGFTVLDRRGWHDGQYARRRYFLERGSESYGPFGAIEDALDEAKRRV